MTTSTPTFQPTEHAKETILGMILSLEQRFGCQPLLDKKTTLNTKYGVFGDNLPKNARHITYFAWGNAGRFNDSPTLTSAQHVLGTNMALYGMRPFRAVPFEQDIPAEERTKYGMRVIKMIDGTPYCLYYLKKINFTTSTVQLLRTDAVSNERVPYQIDYANLNPSPPVRASNGAVSDVADAVSVVLPGVITLTGEEALEAVNVLDGGDTRYAVASEIGFVSASTELVTVNDFSGKPFQYEEAIFAQMVDHYTSIGQPLYAPQDTFTRSVNLSLRNIIDAS